MTRALTAALAALRPGRVLRDKYVCFGLVMLSSSAMNNLFVTYYLDLFVNVVRLDQRGFFLGQTVFMVWNAFNDPLFGWLSDRAMPGTSGVRRRLAVIELGGMAWCAAFVLVWLPPSAAGGWLAAAHFTLALCLYDGMLTLVEVNHSALLADISSSGPERARLNAFSAVCAGLGSLSSFFGHLTWDRGHLAPFQRMTVLVALLCAVVFHLACEGLRQSEQRSRRGSGGGSGGVADGGATASADASCGPCGPGAARREGERSLEDDTEAEVEARRKSAGADADAGLGVRTFVRQLLGHRNFLLFNVLYFVQAFDCTFEKNHFGIFLDGLAGESLSRGVLASIITASFILPWVATAVLTPTVQRRGIYWVVKMILGTRVAWCAFSLAFGPAVPLFSAWFLLSNRVLSEAVCRVCPLIITDLVDEDRYLHRRTSSVSASVVGASTLLGKGSQSLAPMFGYWLVGGATAPARTLLAILIAVPLCCVLLQAVLWRSYSLHGAYLKRVKTFTSRDASFAV